MNDFIQLFIQEMQATIDGMMGRTAVVTHKEDGNVSDDLLPNPFGMVSVDVTLNGSKVSSIGFIMPELLATALPDLMMGGEGNTGKDLMDDDDKDGLKEVFQSITGALSTALGGSSNLPHFAFSIAEVKNVESGGALTEYQKASHFDVKIDSVESQLIMLTTNDLLTHGAKADSKAEAHAGGGGGGKADFSAKEMRNIGMLLDIGLNVKVRIGQKRMLLKDVISMDIGSVVELNQLASDPLEILVNDKIIGKGEVVVVDGNFAIQITEIGSRHERLESLRS
ncbi:flagellar motor switch protein FliY [Helicobacter saguini]|uniref:Flagellar motor switch protein FliN n=1 Tax=Helicobacter saguini TaxID=1548018 RepID=A0A347VNT2_9HELI|nr:flagellar motor switch protein FliY [Helicobacter saguini]MWV61649.1 flagellar motor switch protein FliY [Helicobacter saguini]MWV67679.1 flagellar motor switch protein FliY [Helicobacter saguini]MWV70031.1 flagellar motor switch protein FliY [Helicobacter saguini]MWV72756.1 flagellar motor switch protein FliY [Helicobacter saguini]TLD92733.1 flagellar motor switch protein FliY [Helicobacter saguini]